MPEHLRTQFTAAPGACFLSLLSPSAALFSLAWMFLEQKVSRSSKVSSLPSWPMSPDFLTYSMRYKKMLRHPSDWVSLSHCHYIPRWICVVDSVPGSTHRSATACGAGLFCLTDGKTAGQTHLVADWCTHDSRQALELNSSSVCLWPTPWLLSTPEPELSRSSMLDRHPATWLHIPSHLFPQKEEIKTLNTPSASIKHPDVWHVGKTHLTTCLQIPSINLSPARAPSRPMFLLF